jgi:hypothetical protein
MSSDNVADTELVFKRDGFSVDQIKDGNYILTVRYTCGHVEKLSYAIPDTAFSDGKLATLGRCSACRNRDLVRQAQEANRSLPDLIASE